VAVFRLGFLVMALGTSTGRLCFSVFIRLQHINLIFKMIILFFQGQDLHAQGFYSLFLGKPQGWF